MVIDALASKYPKLYHVADTRNWDSICKHGLLSTTALLDLFEYTDEQRFEIESQLRLEQFRISHPVHGEAIIGDQDTMKNRPAEGLFLEKCLDGITPEEWFEFLNGKTFFWADDMGLRRMLGAELNRNKSHYVITVDSRKLIERHAGRVTLSPINSASLSRMKKRSDDTFRPIGDYPQMRWINELAVDYSVPDILDVTISVDECMIQSLSGKGETVYRKIKRIWPTKKG